MCYELEIIGIYGLNFLAPQLSVRTPLISPACLLLLHKSSSRKKQGSVRKEEIGLYIYLVLQTYREDPLV